MAARQIVVDILGDSQKFNKALGSATGDATKFGNVMQGIGQGIGQKAFNLIEGAVTGVVDVFKDAVTNAENYEVVSTRLDTALQANVKGWDNNRNAVDKFDKSQTDLGFNFTETTAAMAQLVAATGDVSKAQTFLSTAEDLARLKGVSLAEATDALTKVEGGSYRILKSLGIELPKNATQTQALALVQKAAAGQAEAYGKTTAGALDIQKAKAEELSVELGTKLLPITNAITSAEIKLLDAGSNLATTWDEVTAALDKNHTTSGQSRTALLDLAGTLKLFSGGLIDLDAHIKDEADLLELANEKTTFLKTGWVTLGKATDDMLPPIDRLTSKIDTSFGNAIPADFAYAEKAAQLMVKGMVIDLQTGQNDIDAASKNLSDAMLNPIAGSKRMAEIRAILAGKGSVGKELAKALKSSDPLVVEAAKKLQTALEVELQGFKVNLKVSASASVEAFAGGISGGHFKKLASGGRIAPGETAIVGEGGRPEFVTGGSSGAFVTPRVGGTQIININIGNLYGTDGPALDMFTRAIATRLRIATGL